MRRAALPLLIAAYAVGLLLFVYRPVLFGGEQFAFRDAGHFYYPLYLRVQQEWLAGRWPLWNPWENGGQPLLGSPMAAVLYPGKLIYAAFPYAWGARLYVVAHTALAFVGMLALSRSLGIGRIGAGIGGLSYAFGAPVLFQYSNVIYLVGAAWVPWGLRAARRLVEQGGPSSVAELPFILAMQVLGGDPQAAYLTVVCGGGYALILTLGGLGTSRLPLGRLVAALIGVWFVASLVLARLRLTFPGHLGTLWLPAVLGWGMVAGWLAWRWRSSPVDSLAARLVRLMGAGALGLTLTGAQSLPVAEFAVRSSRPDRAGMMRRTGFSLEPYRLVELAWPWAFGHPYPENCTFA